jgi:hypothetical protein
MKVNRKDILGFTEVKGEIKCFVNDNGHIKIIRQNDINVISEEYERIDRELEEIKLNTFWA